MTADKWFLWLKIVATLCSGCSLAFRVLAGRTDGLVWHLLGFGSSVLSLALEVEAQSQYLDRRWLAASIFNVSTPDEAYATWSNYNALGVPLVTIRIASTQQLFVFPKGRTSEEVLRSLSIHEE